MIKLDGFLARSIHTALQYPDWISPLKLPFSVRNYQPNATSPPSQLNPTSQFLTRYCHLLVAV